MPGRLVIITGPSGVGKTSIAEEVFRRRPDIKKLVTYTTRPPRPTEVDGREYHFIDGETFNRLRDAGEFLEYAKVYQYWYGNPRQDLEMLLSSGATVLVVLDVQGALAYEKLMPEALSIFIRAENPGILRDRLLRRGKIKAEDLQERTAQLEAEMDIASSFDAVVENREGAMDQAVSLVLEAIGRAGA